MSTVDNDGARLQSWNNTTTTRGGVENTSHDRLVTETVSLIDTLTSTCMNLWCCPCLCFIEEEEEEEQQQQQKFPKPMMEGDIIFGNVVISNNDEGNNTRNDNKQFTMACSDALGSWPSERSSTADAVCLNIAAIEKCHFSTGSAVHLMNTMIMTLVLNTFFDPTRVFKFLSEHSDFLAEREKAKKKKREDLKASKERGKSDKRLKEEKEPKAEDTNKDESTSKVPNKGNGLDFGEILLDSITSRVRSPWIPRMAMKGQIWFLITQREWVAKDTSPQGMLWILLEVVDNIFPRLVNWKYATRPPIRMPFRKVENRNQIMRFTMLQLLKNLRSDSQGKEITDADILKWVNKKVKSIGRTSHIESSKVFSKRNSLFYLQLTIPNN
ncbi:hypothetical protein JHK82_022855 [Glycine max]|nr:hypothetical protein JHK82_022855 [Glycine max]